VSAPASAAAVLGPGGPLSRKLDGYENRPEQLHFAEAVERAFAERSYLLAEAGTGTGKTLAYLVAAVLSGRRAVISTATKNLQEQVFFKEVPFVRDSLGLDFDAAYLKGRSNYLCLTRYAAFEAAPSFAARDEASAWPKLREWARTTATGDRAELDLPDGFSAWPQLSTTAQTCLGTQCPSYEPCFVTQARRRAEAASIVVVNHALFFADLQLRGARGEGVLPPYDAVIFDEAHAIPDVATEFFATQVSSHRFDELTQDARRVLPEGDSRAGMLSALALKTSGLAEDFFRGIPRVLSLSSEASVRIRPGALKSLDGLAGELTRSLSALAAFVAEVDGPEAVTVGRRCGELASDLDFVREADSVEHVFWGEQRGRGIFLRGAPIEIAHALQRLLYPVLDTAVFTSATLRAGGDFSYFARAMGLEPPPADGSQVLRLAVDSPFDYPRQAALYVAPHLPEPNAPGFVDALADEIVSLCEITGGRAFALFTSLRNMEAAHARAAHRLKGQVLLQGERPRSALLDTFRREPSVLFASHSFWEGVDVPGDALSLVIIDRLPFAPPAEPLTAARIDRCRERGEEPFSTFQLPAAVLALRQGFGRLIRTRKDRGIVAVLDRRLVTKGYSRTFLRSLPAVRRFDSLDSLAAWYREVSGG
jgi:ATP-dependent DNA helicase DinG